MVSATFSSGPLARPAVATAGSPQWHARRARIAASNFGPGGANPRPGRACLPAPAIEHALSEFSGASRAAGRKLSARASASTESKPNLVSLDSDGELHGLEDVDLHTLGSGSGSFDMIVEEVEGEKVYKMVVNPPDWAGHSHLPRNKSGLTSVCIVGGGNAAHVLTGYLGSRKDELDVRLLDDFGDEADRLKAGMAAAGGLTVVNDMGHDVIANLVNISKDPADVIPGAQVIILSLPAFAAEHYLSIIAPYIEEGAIIGSLPAQGGFDIVARKCLGEKGDKVTIFGLETLPWACRLNDYGSKVEVLGTKKQVDFVASPSWKAAEARDVIQELIGPLPVLNQVDNFLAVTLMNINSVWHPCISYGAYKGWEGEPMDTPPPFYEGVDDFAASVLTDVSNEVIAIKEELCRRFPGLDLDATKHVLEWVKDSYHGDIEDESTLRSCINTNKGYKGLVHPCVETEDGRFMPNFKYRYFAEDIPVGLMVTRGIAELAGVATPAMDDVIVQCQEWMGKEYLKDGKVGGANVKETRAPQNYGHTTIEGFMRSCQYDPTCRPDNE